MGRNVIIVDDEDNEIGTEEKIKAHEGGGKLHRAFSIFIFNENGEFLLQRRADGKYHSGGLWTNTCCSHPEPGENIRESAKRRLKEEMGFTCDLVKVHEFIYEASFDTGLTEKEYDHVFFGISEEEPNPDPKEVSEWKYISKDELLRDVRENPDNYTPWFKKTLKVVVEIADSRDIIN